MKWLFIGLLALAGASAGVYLAPGPIEAAAPAPALRPTATPTPAPTPTATPTPTPTPPALTSSKADSPDPVTAGSNLTYTITVLGSPQHEIFPLTITDPLPPGTSFVSDICFGVTPAHGTISGSNVWSIGPVAVLGGMQCTITVTVAATVPDGAVLTNQATATTPGFVLTPETTTTVSNPSGPVGGITRLFAGPTTPRDAAAGSRAVLPYAVAGGLLMAAAALSAAWLTRRRSPNP